jgi:hypothetical protein
VGEQDWRSLSDSRSARGAVALLVRLTGGPEGPPLRENLKVRLYDPRRDPPDEQPETSQA